MCVELDDDDCVAVLVTGVDADVAIVVDATEDVDDLEEEASRS